MIICRSFSRRHRSCMTHTYERKPKSALIIFSYLFFGGVGIELGYFDAHVGLTAPVLLPLRGWKGRKEIVSDLVSLSYDMVCCLVVRVQGKELRVTTGASCCGGWGACLMTCASWATNADTDRWVVRDMKEQAVPLNDGDTLCVMYEIGIAKIRNFWRRRACF